MSNSNQKRLSKDNAVLLMVDHQTGLSNGVGDFTLTEYMNGVTALAKLGKAFNLPTILTTSAETGANGPILPQVRAIFPEAPLISRPGEINAWDNKDFVAAVKKTGRKQLIVAGVSTEVCVAFVSLAAAAEGYEVYAVIDASGTWNKTVQEVAVARMAQAGIVPMTWLAVGAELQRDWRVPEAQKAGRIMSEHMPFYGNIMSGMQPQEK